MCLLSLPLQAWADTFYLETAPTSDRGAANSMLDAARAGGYSARLVRRFELGRGWGFALVVEGFPDSAAATSAATVLAKPVGAALVVYKVAEGKATPVAPPSEATDTTAAEWLAMARESHGGAAGGSSALARAATVHFTFERRFVIDGTAAVARHEYWRDGTSRRLDIKVDQGTEKVSDSTAVTSSAGAWMLSKGRVETRDPGTLVTAVDNFSPEAILTVAVEANRLLSGPDVQDFRLLEGAEGGIRIGSGRDDTHMSLSFVDLDAKTGRISAARYVTEAGPITCEMKDYHEVSPGLVIPYTLVISRADGRRDEVKVERLELLPRAPGGIFDRPGGS